MIGGKRKSQRLAALCARHPYCFWCGVRVIRAQAHALPKGTRPPPQLATRDHLNSRIAYPGGRPKDLRAVVVLSCWECNQARAVAERDDLDWVPPLVAARQLTTNRRHDEREPAAHR